MPFSTHSPIPINEKLTVEELITKLRKRVNINLIACAAEEKCRDKFVREAELNRPGLALTGYLDVFSWQRVQIIGNTETDYLEKLPEDKQLEAFGNITLIYKKKLNARQVEKLIKEKQKKNLEQFEKQIDILELEKELLDVTGLKIAINFNDKKQSGNLNIKCKSLTEFNYIISKIKS